MTADDKFTDFHTKAPSSLKTLHTRLTDTLQGFERMVEEADDDFKPVARRFRDLHSGHVKELRAVLDEAGADYKEDGSFMADVNEAVVATRAAISHVGPEAMAQIRSGEQHVLNAYDAAINALDSEVMTEKLTRMRDELKELLASTRSLG